MKGKSVSADSFKVTGLRQVSQPTKNLDASLAFYRDMLGLPLIAQYGNIAFFDLGGTRLFLEAEEGEGDGEHGSSVLYLQVEDIQASTTALKARGVAFEHEPHAIFKDDAGTFGAPGQTEWMAFFRDPSNNILAISSRE
jgi:catechol 2,3-dioxygenase-like lactoylglutathione lyase family enzyme